MGLIYQVQYFFSWLKWLCQDQPMLTYSGYHCGCCGSWTDEEIKVKKYQSVGKDWDTIGLCEKCIEEGKEYAEREEQYSRC